MFNKLTGESVSSEITCCSFGWNENCIVNHKSAGSQPAFQRCFTVETTSGTMVESTVNYLSILQNGSTLIL